MRGTVATLGQARSTDLAAIARPLQDGLMALETATSFLVEAEAAQAADGSVPYLQLLGTWLTARLALAAERRGAESPNDTKFPLRQACEARFYAEHFLALALGFPPDIIGGSTVLDFDPDQL